MLYVDRLKTHILSRVCDARLVFRIVYCLRIVAYGMTWTGRAAGSSVSGIRRASPAAAAAAASAGVILFALQPRGCLYAYVLASKRCKRSTTITLLVGSSEFPAGCVACRPAEDSLSVSFTVRLGTI